MKLTYRGVSYEYNPVAVETATSEVGGKYRSRDWRFRNLKKPPILVPVLNLKYRGVTYNKPGTVSETTVNKDKAPVSIQEKARLLAIETTKASEKRQQTLLSRSAEEIGFSAHA